MVLQGLFSHFSVANKEARHTVPAEFIMPFLWIPFLLACMPTSLLHTWTYILFFRLLLHLSTKEGGPAFICLLLCSWAMGKFRRAWFNSCVLPAGPAIIMRAETKPLSKLCQVRGYSSRVLGWLLVFRHAGSQSIADVTAWFFKNCCSVRNNTAMQWNCCDWATPECLISWTISRSAPSVSSHLCSRFGKPACQNFFFPLPPFSPAGPYSSSHSSSSLSSETLGRK